MVGKRLVCLFSPLPESPDNIGCYHNQVDDHANCEKRHGGISTVMHGFWLSRLYCFRARITGFYSIHHQ